ncbi:MULTISPECIES: arsenate reductase (glutaredoxin) [Idiomarina]|jgi:arsenate reductase|uniref:Arsenate reductase n=2 Tax=Idiomarina baltica TaxID=190892 RepID=A0A348WN37_9GAMM|nr:MULTISPECIES: arsenate reductase (glutaredoxin) [Idiomarina]MBL73371.1 arsenate reductase (glutaredoxin) [Idiomarinaceae bacterium]MEC8925129.1 arsenate reductase (glutaredoxin) [Pseudomonadota bacterium]EAQ32517.1 Glutaredoxin family protein [Idiomarina baltica OS145]KXS35595.1 MAG: arsenate reductase [Idiomarina sp. T82-3]MBR37648.1 arsenate reductase (glutaredoxin) [Idiomarina sp.]|tara:strand:+ start:9506 stop:9856 length:351 start_codon:yes stop_codon:yes gene_type:complete
MSKVTIYHNPRCSKSRQTLELLQQHGIEPTIIKYLETPPSQAELSSLLNKLDISPRQLMRTKEAVYKELKLADESDDEVLLTSMVNNPKLIERPIVVKGEKAVLGRPPENALELIK